MNYNYFEEIILSYLTDKSYDAYEALVAIAKREEGGLKGKEDVRRIINAIIDNAADGTFFM